MTDDPGERDRTLNAAGFDATVISGATDTGSEREGSRPATVGAARFRIGTLIGRGGMGEVVSAIDDHIGREVAVKRLTRGRGDADSEARFMREARVQGRLDHPAVVPVYDLGVDDTGVPYFAMKRLAGTTLAEVMTAQAAGDAAAIAHWPRRTLLARLVDVAQAVEFAHSRGVTHRDLKPSNIMLGEYGEAYVLDWGISRVAEDGPPVAAAPTVGAPPRSTAGQDVTPTATGTVLGTPGYMAPEQLVGGEVGAQADIYALGCILFEIATGQPAFPRGPEAVQATLAAGALRPRQRHPEVDVAPELDQLCAVATAPAAAERFTTVRAFAAALEGYLAGDRDVARRRELAAAHAASARDASLAGDESGRAEGMRQAGLALALDPDNAGAQAVLAQLLLEPPATIPDAVRKGVEAERLATGQVQLRTAARAYLGYLVLSPGLFWMGIREEWPIIVLLVLIVANAGISELGARRASAVGKLFYLSLAAHGLLLATSGLVFSPLLLLPCFAVGSITPYMSQTTAYRPRLILAVHAGSVVAPLVLEWIGVVPRTFAIERGALVITPWVVHFSTIPVLSFVLTTVLLQLIVAVVWVQRQRAVQERAEERVHLHSWHLRQLVPEASGAAGSMPGKRAEAGSPPTPETRPPRS